MVTCPVCGDDELTLVRKLDGEARILSCAKCGHEWQRGQVPRPDGTASLGRERRKSGPTSSEIASHPNREHFLAAMNWWSDEDDSLSPISPTLGIPIAYNHMTRRFSAAIHGGTTGNVTYSAIPLAKGQSHGCVNPKNSSGIRCVSTTLQSGPGGTIVQAGRLENKRNLGCRHHSPRTSAGPLVPSAFTRWGWTPLALRSVVERRANHQPGHSLLEPRLQQTKPTCKASAESDTPFA